MKDETAPMSAYTAGLIPEVVYHLPGTRLSWPSKALPIHICYAYHRAGNKPIAGTLNVFAKAMGETTASISKSFKSLREAGWLDSNGWGCYWPTKGLRELYGQGNAEPDLADMPAYSPETVTQPAARVPKAGFVYVMLNKRNGFYKIGFSVQPSYREKTLQAEEPEIEMLGCFAGTMGDEKCLHARYYAKRIRGEWFKLTAAEVAQILAY